MIPGRMSVGEQSNSSRKMGVTMDEQDLHLAQLLVHGPRATHLELATIWRCRCKRCTVAYSSCRSIRS